ncbi:MAG: UvrD-helicase domain-containing protein [Proteobacteria bacterium]|nr:UvrD-helicase domain-containing protein [Pseudomonadota bacterium]MBU1716660.1 UvrD-helicase domain-containing protein [Pseudomonadota bacterium]
MKLPKLTTIPAGAGSGKTYTIQKTLCDWVKKKLVEPDRIVAVTFTEAAASELKGRIRAELVNNGRPEDALKLERAYISTIHGFGLRVISEFAFEAGMSPRPRLLNEDEEDIFIRRALAVTKKADPVINNLYQFGYSYDFNTGKGAEDLFRERILGLIGKLRSIGRSEEDSNLYPAVAKKISDIYGPTGAADQMKRALWRAVKDLLGKFPGNLAQDFEGNATAVRDLSKNYYDLKKAEQGTFLDKDWSLWQRLRSLRTIKLSDEYKDLAERVMAAAESLPMHPGPLREALLHVEALLGASQDALHKYGEQKKEKGLVDYTDMLAIARKLLVSDSSVLAELKSRVGCLVIDEFQDTNPLQFSLLWALFEAGVPTLIVGDLKQAIMRFQNADSRLMETIQEQQVESIQPLKGNWRSSKPLMKWVNQVGDGLFEDKYQRLTPKADFTSKMSPLEAIIFNERGKVETRAQQTCLRIKALLEEEQEVWDKSRKEYRSIRGGDIAILCPTNPRLEDYAAALRTLGIRVRLAQDGWFESPIVQILYYALSYVTDPADIHAGLYLAVTELGSINLEDALKEITRGKSLNDPLLRKLVEHQDNFDGLTVDCLIGKVIGVLDLYGAVSCWPEADQARSDLLRFQGEAQGFLQANREALVSGGYHGDDLKTFLAWLRKRVESDNGQSDPRVIDEDAVQLMTWHKSKGREWPVVAVCSGDREVEPRLPTFDVAYKDFADLNFILEKAGLEFSPKFIAPEQNEKFIKKLWPDTEKDARNLLYVALTRAREKLIIECHQYQKEGTSSCWNILKECCGIDFKANKMIMDGKSFDCRITATTADSPPEFENDTDLPESKLLKLGRRAIIAGEVPGGLILETMSPSLLHGAEFEGKPDLQTADYGYPLQLELEMSATNRGTILHRCFEITAGVPDNIKHINRATGYDFSAEQQSQIAGATTAFYHWVKNELNPIGMDTEVPVLFADDNGSVVSGEIDLLVETEEGYWIIDHKSDVTDDLEERFLYYLPQLNCYAEGVRKSGLDKPVFGVMVNWIYSGVVMK